MDAGLQARKPILLYVMQTLCVIFTLMIILSSVRRFVSNDMHMNSPILALVTTLLWVLTCTGFLLRKKWGWLMFLGGIYFLLLNNINLLVSVRLDITLVYFIPPLIAIIMIVLLNRDQILETYNVVNQEGFVLQARAANFAVFCIFCGLFLFTEPFTANALSTSSVMAKGYVMLLGVIFGISGLGIWFDNKLSIKAMQPLLIFVLLSSSYILIKDWFSINGYFKPEQIVFYIIFSLFVVLYWSVFLKNRLLSIQN